MLRTCLLAAVVVGALLNAGPARAQSRLTDASVTWSYARPRSTPAHRLEIGGGITLAVGTGVAVLGALLAINPGCTSGECLDSAGLRQFFGDIFGGIGGFAMLIGALLWASSTSASTAPAPVALVGGPGDVGAAVRVAL